jgi:hypothetical protein
MTTNGERTGPIVEKLEGEYAAASLRVVRAEADYRLACVQAEAVDPGPGRDVVRSSRRQGLEDARRELEGVGAALVHLYVVTSLSASTGGDRPSPYIGL